MRDEKYWIDSSVNCMLMSERGTLDFEKQLKAIYETLSNDLEKELVFIFSKYGSGDKLLYIDLRKRLDDAALKKFKAQIKVAYNSFDLNTITKEFFTLSRKLAERKTLTVLEYLQYMCWYYVLLLATKKLEYTESLLTDTYMGAYYVDLYNYRNGVEKDVDFLPLSGSAGSHAAKTSWERTNYYDKAEYSTTQLKNTLDTKLPQFIAMGYTVNTIMNEINPLLKIRYNGDVANTRSFVTLVNNKAHTDLMQSLSISKYEYVAVLDERTTEICRNMNGSVFNLSDAAIGVNVPPLHYNCRSSIRPILTNDVEKKLNRLGTISRRTTITSWLKENLPENQQYIMDYIKKYR